MTDQWKTYDSDGDRRVVVTKNLPGEHWVEVLQDAGCRVEVSESREILPPEEIRRAIGTQCDGVIGQLTESWNGELFRTLRAAGGIVYSNYAVGYDNVDVEAATDNGIAVGNTPGVLTETTAEMAVALTGAVARRVVEADAFMRSGKFHGWLPDLFLGQLLWRKTLGVIGAGRIGSAYARMMVQGHHMDLIYYDVRDNRELEKQISAFGRHLESLDEEPVSCRRAESLEELLESSDVISLHPALTEETHHMIGGKEFEMMKQDAILINVSRGAVIDEGALVAHCKKNPEFRAGLDVYEDEPEMKPGLADLKNVVVVPHLGSATRWTREGMASLAACNVAGILQGYPVWDGDDISDFLEAEPPQAAPSIVNAGSVAVAKTDGT